MKDIQEHAFYIAPRVFEGIGMSFLEAMAMGRCVIALNNPTMNEYIIDGVTGILYNPQSTHSLCEYDIEKIQNNTIEYIREGYRKWQKDIKQIPEYIESTPQIKKLKLFLYYFPRIFENRFLYIKIERRRNSKKLCINIFGIKIRIRL